eukprot:scaffold109582_cov30-Tisochrysis_lutea.AAC.1
MQQQMMQRQQQMQMHPHGQQIPQGQQQFHPMQNMMQKGQPQGGQEQLGVGQGCTQQPGGRSWAGNDDGAANNAFKRGRY